MTRKSKKTTKKVKKVKVSLEKQVYDIIYGNKKNKTITNGDVLKILTKWISKGDLKPRERLIKRLHDAFYIPNK